jgi:fructokinase
VIRIGVDLGGTKIEAIALGPDGSERARLRVPTPRSYTASLDAIADLVARVDDGAVGRCPVGVGIPGAISPVTGVVKNANSTWLIGQPLHQDLETRLDRPVRLENDANCFALSEAVDGAGAGADVVFGVILGTGVGGGIVVQGRPLRGRQLIAGEWGHNPLPWPTPDESPGPPCYCGLEGCLETFLSGPGMVSDHLRVTAESLTTHEIHEALSAGDPGASATFRRYVDRLARGLATVINVLDPDVVVLGGGMSNFPDLASRTRQALGAYVFTDEVKTEVRRNRHGDSGGVRGAAWLWPPGGES